MTDRGSEFVAGMLENLCENYHIEIENLPAYRPDLKGVVEKLFDLIQSAYKPLLKGKGVIESDTQERGAPDYRRQGTLDLEQFTAVVLRCVLFYNAKSVQTGFTRIPAMIEANTPPLAASIWSFCEAQDDCPVHEATDKRLLYTLLPRIPIPAMQPTPANRTALHPAAKTTTPRPAKQRPLPLHRLLLPHPRPRRSPSPTPTLSASTLQAARRQATTSTSAKSGAA